MPRKDSKGDVRTAASRSDSPTISSTSTASAASNSAVERALDALSSDGLLHSLSMMMTRDDGWLRVVPHVGESLIYAKWKFTSGPWTGYYAMYRCDNFSPIEALCGLNRKLLLIDAGMSRPVYDTPYNS